MKSKKKLTELNSQSILIDLWKYHKNTVASTFYFDKFVYAKKELRNGVILVFNFNSKELSLTSQDFFYTCHPIVFGTLLAEYNDDITLLLESHD